jgi:hypothetical protein
MLLPLPTAGAANDGAPNEPAVDKIKATTEMLFRINI